MYPGVLQLEGLDTVLSAAIVSDLIRVVWIFNLENCNLTDFPLFRLSLDFALAHVYCVTVHFDLSHCTCYGSVCCWLALAYRTTSNVKRATLLIVMAKAPHRHSYFNKSCLGHEVSVRSAGGVFHAL